ncbi:hypothetical protein CkaCkLH20_07031 [Colletotrichum karsti]|uniref:Glycine-rich cell wall structural protein 1 n=1 Tax=Colletotrichum karsti TaxID=1095194 RepID=A0A9P6IBL9_9PEZI|nr:uncharacterized protein CkaCkLH20_07031 [Colletotrichum karsti]KAF9875650.1 hypothetical protein CkaCkLH20_07031 [Colletotrichum karsti]
METINNMATGVSKAIFGTNEAREEPVSGVTGNTSNGEPYDAGNIEEPQKKAHVVDANAEHTATTSTPATAPTTSHTKEDPVKHEDKIGKPELKNQSVEDAAPHDSAAGKTDTRLPEDPATDPKPKNLDVSNSGTGPENKTDDLTGPGPRPLETVAKERGGDAGNVKGASHDGGLTGGDTAEEEEDGPQKKSHGEGTGEKYIKSTGLAADGGDFDATKPGAGREADRLMDEKDPAAAAAKAAATSKPIDNTHSTGSQERTQSPNESTGKEKKSLGDKIKEKLHRH